MEGGTENFGCLMFDFGWGGKDEDEDEDEIEDREFCAILLRC